MRHEVANEPLDHRLVSESTALRDALELEASSSWYLAGEGLRRTASNLPMNVGFARERAKVLARAATCLELAGQDRDAAWAYYDAASALRSLGAERQVGELYNRAAARFRAAGEYFNAGHSLMCAAQIFAEMPYDLLNTRDNIPPVPLSAGKFTAAAGCLSAAAEEFLKTKEQGWARSVYWQAGEMHRRELPCVQAAEAFNQALIVCVRIDRTLDPPYLRRALPLSEEERQSEIDPVEVLEAAVREYAQTDIQADEEMIRIFRAYAFELREVGNRRESREFYIRWRRWHERLCWKRRRIREWLGHVVWRLSCLYGESLTRWAASCAGVLLIFAIVYWRLDAIGPVRTWVDYPYFSLVTLTTFGSGDLSPCGTVGQGLVGLEILAGILLFGLLLTFLSRKVFED